MTDITIYLIIGTVIFLGIYGVYYFFSKYLEKHSVYVQNIKTTLETYGKLYEEGLYLLYEYKGEMYSVIIIKVQKNAKFQFNSRVIWEKRLGKKVYYTDQTIFSKMPNKKIVIVYPNTGPFTYHYDENEIRYTKPNERIWDMHIMHASELETVLKEGL